MSIRSLFGVLELFFFFGESAVGVFGPWIGMDVYIYTHTHNFIFDN